MDTASLCRRDAETPHEVPHQNLTGKNRREELLSDGAPQWEASMITFSGPALVHTKQIRH